MFKAMIVLTRREDMTHAEFAQWWLHEHHSMAADLPKIRKAVFNEVADGFDEAGIDGVAELWFDTREDFDSAYATEIGKATAQDSLDHVSGRVRLIVSENIVVD
jgi:uncharacterized protein (TIGR02118 family)